MTAVEVTRDRIKKIISNKGDVRLLIVIYAVWIMMMTWILWTPLPSAPTAPSIFGEVDVAACRDIVLDHAKCIADENAKAATMAITYRSAIILLTLPFLILLAAIAAFIFEWIREGYRKPN